MKLLMLKVLSLHDSVMKYVACSLVKRFNKSYKAGRMTNHSFRKIQEKVLLQHVI